MRRSLTAVAVVFALTGFAANGSSGASAAAKPASRHAASGLVVAPDGGNPEAYGELTHPERFNRSLFDNTPDITAEASAKDLLAPAAVTATAGTKFAGFNAVAPQRLLDTRNGIGAPKAPVGEGKVITLAVRGAGGVPADADAVVLNVTAVEPSVGGYITVWPTGLAQPGSSNLNTEANKNVPNLVATRIGADGSVSFFNAFGTVQLLADVVAWTRADNHFTSVPPQRILDTRGGLGIAHALAANETADLTVAGVAGLPATGVGVVVLNVTATRPTAASYLTVFPSGSTKPNASNLNMSTGQNVPNLVFASVGTNGKVSIFNAFGTTDVLADLVGWIPSGGAFLSLNPTRMMDTRTGSGTYGLATDATTTLAKPLGKLPAGRVDLDFRSLYPAYPAVAAYALNVTIAEPTVDGYLTVWPAGSPQPNASSLNFRAGETVANSVLMSPGTAGRISLAIPAGATHVIVDLVGVVPLQNALDTPDDDAGSSFHVVFVQGSDAVADPNMVTTIRTEVGAFDGYLFAQTGQHLRFDKAAGQIEVTTWRIPTLTTAQLALWPEDVNSTLLYQLQADGLAAPFTRRWLVYVDASRPHPNGTGLCGLAVTPFTTLFRDSACGTVNGLVNAGAVGLSVNAAQVALHEMFHGLGAVPTCAPDYDFTTPSTGHVNIPNDLMYWNAGVQPKTIDTATSRNYWGRNGSTPCIDLSKSAYIAPLPHP